MLVTTPPTNPTFTTKLTAPYKPLSKRLEELCGNKGNGCSCLWHSWFSFTVNASLILLVMKDYSVRGVKLNKFFGILRMFSIFSFPVHAALTDLSFLLKSKISLASLAVDTWLSLHEFITKKPSISFKVYSLFNERRVPAASIHTIFLISVSFCKSRI